jgi:hypothetical protein
MHNQPAAGEDTFGFRPSVAKDKLKHIRPTTAPPVPDLSKVDAAAEQVGFVSRETPLPTPAPPESYSTYSAQPVPIAVPTIAINMRVPNDLAGAFRRFCTENRYSYPEALKEIMKRAGIQTK